MEFPLEFPTIEINMGDDDPLLLPGKFVVCGRCRGTGTHTNPAIDGHGISREEMDELGDEFFEDYMSGVYDVRCEECGGERVVTVIDRKRATTAQIGAYEDDLREKWEYEAMVAAELRAGC